MEQAIEVPAEWGSIERLIAFTDEIEGGLSLSDDQGYLLRLVVEEIATNIVKYGYEGFNRGVIQLRCACEGGTLQVAIRDHGHPFDPHECPEPDMSDDVHARTVGGLGLFLVREFADHLSYHHDASSGWNELVVVKGAS
jgi:anti-sigma regulatory factor (Ser/Thr protein kinase)